MGKPRKFIRVIQQPSGTFDLTEKKGEGVEIPGWSLHAKSKRLYRITAPSQRDYRPLADLDRIAAAFLNEGKYVTLSGLDWAIVTGFPEPDAIQEEYKTQPYGEGISREWAERNVDNPSGRSVVNRYRKYEGKPLLPPLPHHWTSDDGAASSEANSVNGIAPAPISNERLEDCYGAWAECKVTEGCGAAYIKDVKTSFDRFVRVVTNKPISTLTPDDFIKWRGWMEKQYQKRDSPKWFNDQHENVGKVFDFIADEYEDSGRFTLPDGINRWVNKWKRKTYKAAKANRIEMPVDVVQTVTALADEWAAIDPDSIDATTNKGKAKRLQARNRKHEGQQLGLMIRLAACCGLDNVDCQRITWEHIKESPHGFTYMDFPRIKVKRKSGIPVDRKTPILPSIADALRAIRPAGKPKGSIFLNSKGRPYSKSTHDNALKRLFAEAEVNGWTFKHLRNVGPTLGRRGKLTKDERDALLGHTVSVDGQTCSVFYEGDVDETYLVDLVNLIGKDYFSGEVITTKDA